MFLVDFQNCSIHYTIEQGLQLSWLEQYTHNVLVPGSSPGGPTKNYFLEINKYIKANFTTNKVFTFPNLDSNLLPDLYKNSELYVFTSYCEVFGLTSLEAMSQKIPVVISNRSALPEINGDAAVYFDPDDISEIKGSLKKVLIDKQLKQKLIDNGNRQLKKFNNRENIKKTIKIIENTI